MFFVEFESGKWLDFPHLNLDFGGVKCELQTLIFRNEKKDHFFAQGRFGGDVWIMFDSMNKRNNKIMKKFCYPVDGRSLEPFLGIYVRTTKAAIWNPK